MGSFTTRQIIAYLALGACGLVVGFLISGWGSGAAVEAQGSGRREELRQPLTALDGPSAEARARRLLRDGVRPSAIWEALEACDSEALARLYASTGRGIERNVRMRHLLVISRWLEVDPQAAADAAAAEWDGLMALPKVVGIWASSDPGAALDYLLDSPGKPGAGFALGPVVSAARRIDGYDMAALLERLPVGDKRRGGQFSA